MITKKEMAQLAREVTDRANRETAPGGYSHGYLQGFADALKEIAQMQYYAISSDGGNTWTWQWLTDEEVEEEKQKGNEVRR